MAAKGMGSEPAAETRHHPVSELASYYPVAAVSEIGSVAFESAIGSAAPSGSPIEMATSLQLLDFGEEILQHFARLWSTRFSTTCNASSRLHGRSKSSGRPISTRLTCVSDYVMRARGRLIPSTRAIGKVGRSFRVFHQGYDANTGCPESALARGRRAIIDAFTPPNALLAHGRQIAFRYCGTTLQQ